MGVGRRGERYYFTVYDSVNHGHSRNPPFIQSALYFLRFHAILPDSLLSSNSRWRSVFCNVCSEGIPQPLAAETFFRKLPPGFKKLGERTDDEDGARAIRGSCCEPHVSPASWNGAVPQVEWMVVLRPHGEQILPSHAKCPPAPGAKEFRRCLP